MQLKIFHFFQITSLLASIFFAKGLGYFKLKAFIPLLALTCFIEIVATNAENFGLGSNFFLYNYYLLLSQPFFFYLFFKMLDIKGRFANIFKLICLFCIVLIYINYFFVQGTLKFNFYNYIFISIINIICSILVILKTTFVDEFKIGKEDFGVPYLIICSAILFFYLGTVSILGLQSFILNNKIEIFGKSLYRFFMPIFNTLLYSAYSFSFYKCHQQSKKY